jgi:hypothetical protein
MIFSCSSNAIVMLEQCICLPGLHQFPKETCLWQENPRVAAAGGLRVAPGQRKDHLGRPEITDQNSIEPLIIRPGSVVATPIVIIPVSICEEISRQRRQLLLVTTNLFFQS